MQFTELWRTGLWITEENERAVRLFPVLVEQSHLHLWEPGEPIAHGKRLLIGVVDWSLYDLALLDVLNQTIHDGKSAVDRIDVFNLDQAAQTKNLENYVTGLDEVRDTPVVGMWVDGILGRKAIGWRATGMISDVFGIRLRWDHNNWKYDVEWDVAPGPQRTPPSDLDSPRS